MKKVCVTAIVFWFIISSSINSFATDWWVDSLGSGDGTDSTTPTNSIQGAIDASSAGDTINIYGAADRVYTHTNIHYIVDKESLTLTDWGTEKPIIRTADPPSGDDDAILDSIIEIATNDVTLRNLRFEIYHNTYRSGDSVVELTGLAATPRHNTTIEGCEFVMVDGPGGAYNSGSILDMGGTINATNFLIQNCYFEDVCRLDAYRYPVIRGKATHWLITKNTFLRTGTSVKPDDSKYVIVTSNLFLNCLNDQNHDGNEAGGIVAASYNDLQDSEISFNIAWNTNGIDTYFLGKGRSGLKGDTRVFNNTTYGMEMFCWADAGGYPNESWEPLIVNNLILNSATTNFMTTPDTNSLTYTTNTVIRNNLWYGGSTNLFGPNMTNGVLAPNYNAEVTIINLDDPSSPDFMRPRAGATPELLQGYGSVDISYPSYIGALEPAPGGLLFLVQ